MKVSDIVETIYWKKLWVLVEQDFIYWVNIHEWVIRVGVGYPYPTRLVRAGFLGDIKGTMNIKSKNVLFSSLNLHIFSLQEFENIRLQVGTRTEIVVSKRGARCSEGIAIPLFIWLNRKIQFMMLWTYFLENLWYYWTKQAAFKRGTTSQRVMECFFFRFVCNLWSKKNRKRKKYLVFFYFF